MEKITEIYNIVSEYLDTNIYPFLLNHPRIIRYGSLIILFLSIFAILFGIFHRNSEKLNDVMTKMNRDFVTRRMNRYVKDYIPIALSDFFDNNYKYSRFFKTKIGSHKLFNTSWKYFLWSIGISIISGIVTLIFSKSILALIVFALVFIVLEGYLFVLRQINYERVSNELVNFLNLLGNYSTANTEVFSVFMQISAHLDNPLSECLLECCAEAQNTETNSIAILQNLCNKIEVPKFREIIKSLEISQRYSGDFVDTVMSNRSSVSNFIKSKSAIKRMATENGISAGFCFMALIGVMFVTGSVLGVNLISVMFQTTVGIIVFVIAMACVLYFVKKIIEVTN